MTIINISNIYKINENNTILIEKVYQNYYTIRILHSIEDLVGSVTFRNYSGAYLDENYNMKSCQNLQKILEKIIERNIIEIRIFL